jgi:hypothetical protein
MDVPNLDNLTDIGLRGGVDMRPTLLRVLTDLYTHKLAHTPEEERHYTELAMRLLDSVDAQTRTSVAARLARHLSPPLRVIQRLANDLPDVAAPLRSHRLLQPAAQIFEPTPSVLAEVPHSAQPIPARRDVSGSHSYRVIDSAIAHELNEMFFAADADERRLILLNLPIVAPIPAGHITVSRDRATAEHLEGAALGRNRDQFVEYLAPALRIPHEQARRIIRDDLGEPLAVAAKALSTPRDVVYRLLMFVNPVVGLSAARVHTLAALYDELTSQAAEGMVAIWQSLRVEERVKPAHQPLFYDDQAQDRARHTPSTVRRTSIAAVPNQRRDAS